MKTCCYCQMRGVNVARTSGGWERLCNWHWVLFGTGELRVVLG